jgi:hypothetical protein
LLTSLNEEVDGELMEIVDAHVHMGGRPRREKFDKEKSSVAAEPTITPALTK